MSEWTPWSVCIVDPNGATGGGTGGTGSTGSTGSTAGIQFRSRTILTPPRNGGTVCGPTGESQSCNPFAPQNCVLSEWSEWSVCRQGQQTRTRTIIQNPTNNGTPCGETAQTKECTETPSYLNIVSTNNDSYVAVRKFNGAFYLAPSYDKMTSDEINYEFYFDAQNYLQIKIQSVYQYVNHDPTNSTITFSTSVSGNTVQLFKQSDRYFLNNCAEGKGLGNIIKADIASAVLGVVGVNFNNCTLVKITTSKSLPPAKYIGVIKDGNNAPLKKAYLCYQKNKIFTSVIGTNLVDTNLQFYIDPATGNLMILKAPENTLFFISQTDNASGAFDLVKNPDPNTCLNYTPEGFISIKTVFLQYFTNFTNNNNLQLKATNNTSSRLTFEIVSQPVTPELSRLFTTVPNVGTQYLTLGGSNIAQVLKYFLYLSPNSGSANELLLNNQYIMVKNAENVFKFIKIGASNIDTLYFFELSSEFPNSNNQDSYLSFSPVKSVLKTGTTTVPRYKNFNNVDGSVISNGIYMISSTDNSILFTLNNLSGNTIIPLPDRVLCYTVADGPLRMNIWIDDPDCKSKGGWTFMAKIKVYSTQGTGRQKYTVYTAPGPDRALIKFGDDSPGGGWNKSGEFYAYATPQPDAVANYVKLAPDGPVREVIVSSTEVLNQWPTHVTFYSYNIEPAYKKVPCVERGAPIYRCNASSGAYFYADLVTRASQCGVDDGTLTYIGDGIKDSDPCQLEKPSNLYVCATYGYSSAEARATQCSQDGGVGKFVGDRSYYY
jgi:hypothetical protein